MTDFYQSIVSSLPIHLQQFAVSQNYEKYTGQDHAVWRYIMRRNLQFLSNHAHPAYLSGLKKTGITVDRIPNIDEMNTCLDKIGWRAIVVDGFIPPAAFMELQALKVLAISAEMRSIRHILYTPAPDIVHEAAGHAPIIADEEYSEYLQAFGESGSKAISSRQDYDIYEAIRYLSIIKEYPNASDEEIRNAELDLENKIKANTDPSESTKLSRLHWWTVEYGLYGTPDNFSIYGAGLLSSVGESQACLKPNVKKIPLTVDCVNQKYDITTMQPQLYVNRDWQHLKDVLVEFAQTMSFKKGGLRSLELALESQNIATFVYSSGLQVSGELVKIHTRHNNVSYLQTSGITALALNDIELTGHGIEYHKSGFGSPVGKLKSATKPLELFSESDLEKLDIQVNHICELLFDSGIRVGGKVKSITRENGKNILISFSDCIVTNHKNEFLFQPEWGIYDMAIGEKIVSVFTGPADKSKFNVFPAKSGRKTIPIDISDKQKKLFGIYNTIRVLRENPTAIHSELVNIYNLIQRDYSDDWLIKLELLELAKSLNINNDFIYQLSNDLENQKLAENDRELITAGMVLVNR